MRLSNFYWTLLLLAASAAGSNQGVRAVGSRNVLSIDQNAGLRFEQKPDQVLNRPKRHLQSKMLSSDKSTKPRISTTMSSVKMTPSAFRAHLRGKGSSKSKGTGSSKSSKSFTPNNRKCRTKSSKSHKSSKSDSTKKVKFACGGLKDHSDAPSMAPTARATTSAPSSLPSAIPAETWIPTAVESSSPNIEPSTSLAPTMVETVPTTSWPTNAPSKNSMGGTVSPVSVPHPTPTPAPSIEDSMPRESASRSPSPTKEATSMPSSRAETLTSSPVPVTTWPPTAAAAPSSSATHANASASPSLAEKDILSLSQSEEAYDNEADDPVLKVCRCNEEAECVHGPLAQGLDLQLCFSVSPSLLSIEFIDNLYLTQTGLYLQTIFADRLQVDGEAVVSCTDSRQECVIATPVDDGFFLPELPPNIRVKGTAVVGALPSRRSLSESTAVVSFELVVSLEKSGYDGRVDNMGQAPQTQKVEVQKKPWVYGICIAVVTGAVFAVSYFDYAVLFFEQTHESDVDEEQVDVTDSE